MASSLAVTAVGAELVLRARPAWVRGARPAIYPGERADRPSRSFVDDPELGWRMRPGRSFRWTTDGERDLYVADADGFRVGPDVEAEPTGAPRRRIALVGDSFAFGVGVEYEETFGARLEGLLPGTSVRNLAMPGYGLDQMWMCVRHVALHLGPRLVVVAFIDSDLDRTLTAYRVAEGLGKPTFQLEGGRLRLQTPEDRPNGWRIWLASLRSMRLADGALRALARQRPIGTFWHRNASILRAIRTECVAAGVGVLFVRLPLPERTAFPQLARFFADEGADYLDLGTSAPPGAHFDHDRHIDEDGHRWVANRLAEHLAAEWTPIGGGQPARESFGRARRPTAIRGDVSKPEASAPGAL